MAALPENMLKILYFYLVKLPFVYILVAIGFVFEFVATFPFVVLVSIDTYRQKNR
ncbi:MAG: hypothetical protein R6T92_12600 [Desulfosalsimonadaceae bacterium]